MESKIVLNLWFLSGSWLIFIDLSFSPIFLFEKHIKIERLTDKALWGTLSPNKICFAWFYSMLSRTVLIEVQLFHFGIVWRIHFFSFIPFFFFSLLTCSDLSVCSKYMLYFFQSAVNKAVNIVLSIAKDIPLWKFAYLHHKQQKVSILFWLF